MKLHELKEMASRTLAVVTSVVLCTLKVAMNDITMGTAYAI